MPALLKSWIPWALHGREGERCPLHLAGNRACVWYGQLGLPSQADAYRFPAQPPGPELEQRVAGVYGFWPGPPARGGWTRSRRTCRAS